MWMAKIPQSYLTTVCPLRHDTHNSAACWKLSTHYSDVILDVMASQITSLAIVFSTVYSGGDQRKHQSSASLAFKLMWGIHRGPVNSPQKGLVTRKMFPFDDVIMLCCVAVGYWLFLPISLRVSSFEPFESNNIAPRGSESSPGWYGFIDHTNPRENDQMIITKHNTTKPNIPYGSYLDWVLMDYH